MLPPVRTLMYPQILCHPDRHADIQPSLRHRSDPNLPVSHQEQSLTRTRPRAGITIVQQDLRLIEVYISCRPHRAVGGSGGVGVAPGRISCGDGEHDKKE